MRQFVFIFAFSIGLFSMVNALPEQALAMNYKLSHQLLPSGETVNVLRMEGQITSGEWALWKRAVSNLSPDQNTLFVVRSPGGDAAHGLFLLNHVEEFLADQKALGREVAVLAEKDCSSMCVPLYYAFPRRLSYPTTRFGLHAIHDDMGSNPAFTANYLNKLREIARSRNDQDMLNWLSEKEHSGAFSTPELDVNLASDLESHHSGIIPDGSLISSETMAAEKLSPLVDVQGKDLSWTHPDYRKIISNIWFYVARDLAKLPLNKVPAPKLQLEPFSRAEQSPEFTLWQNEWIINNISVWMEWTEIVGVPREKITKQWVRERINEIYPFPVTFRGMHYDGTGVVQVNPDTTYLSMVTPDQNRTTWRDYVGYGYYVTGHEFMHYALSKKGVPDILHHCIYVISVDGKPSLMERLNNRLINSGVAGALLPRYGVNQETQLTPCTQLNTQQVGDSARYAKELSQD